MKTKPNLLADSDMLTLELTAAKKQLQRETVRRKAADTALSKSQEHYDLLLKQSRLMEEQSQHLSSQILLAQEKERTQVSSELQDGISQILTGINLRLAALKVEISSHSGK